MGSQRLVACHANGEGSARPLARSREVAVVGETDQRRFPPVVNGFGDHVANHAALPLDLGAGRARGFGVAREVIALLERLHRHLGKGLELLAKRLDGAMPIVRGPRPRRGVVAPLAQLAGGAAQALDRPVGFFFFGPPAHRTPERSADALFRLAQLIVQPRGKRFVEQAIGLGLGKHGERRIDMGFHRPLA